MSADQVKKRPGVHKTGDVTLKRGAAAQIGEAEGSALKKLPGKKKPPTLTLKRGKNQSS